jgi:hypothetical protein
MLSFLFSNGYVYLKIKSTVRHYSVYVYINIPDPKMAASDKSEFLLTALKVFKNSSGDADPKAINVTAAI